MGESVSRRWRRHAQLYVHVFILPARVGHYFALRDEIQEYLETAADHFDVRRSIHFNTRAVRAVYRPDVCQWFVTTEDRSGRQEVLTASVVISASGIFNPPLVPNLPGADTWAREKWHSSQWPAHGTKKGKRVAMIGNGASAMQIGPAICKDAEYLTIFQRKPHWISRFPRFRMAIPEEVQYLARTIPLYRAWYRVRLGWIWNDRAYSTFQMDPTWEHPDRSLNARNDAQRIYLTKYIRDELGDRAEDLLPKVLPDYPPFAKRMLLDNGWYRMLRRDNVELVDDPITQIDRTKIITSDGQSREFDVLIYATGFDVSRMVNTYEVIGEAGVSLREAWEDDNARAYLGTVVPHFPNFFILYGPNLQPGHGGSIMFILELQMRYIIGMIRQMVAQGIRSVSMREDIFTKYNDDVDERNSRMAWSHTGLRTYVRNDRGRVVVNSPYRNIDLFHMMDPRLEDYQCLPRKLAGEDLRSERTGASVQVSGAPSDR